MKPANGIQIDGTHGHDNSAPMESHSSFKGDELEGHGNDLVSNFLNSMESRKVTNG